MDVHIYSLILIVSEEGVFPDVIKDECNFL